MRIRESTKRPPPFKGEHLKQALEDKPACNSNYYAYLQASLCPSPQGQAPRFPHDWFKNSVHPDTPHMAGWTISGRVHRKSSARQFTHLSTIQAYTAQLQSSHGIQIEALGLRQY